MFLIWITNSRVTGKMKNKSMQAAMSILISMDHLVYKKLGIMHGTKNYGVALLSRFFEQVIFVKITTAVITNNMSMHIRKKKKMPWLPVPTHVLIHGQ